MSSPDWSRHIYSGDDNSYYAAPVFNTDLKNNSHEKDVPRKPAPTLSRQSTCRPTSALYLPHKKRKSKIK
uniref:Uncharacterized protein n=1 Tax=Heterorhabditis bacteriophora TaxID=37862 RepID=A0A1I7XNX9_HETBA